MTVVPKIAAQLGFQKMKYAVVERERRWLCRSVPRERIYESFDIADLYVTGTRLRLRDARPLGGGPAMLRLTRKADVDARTRLITSIYLPEAEFAVMKAALSGVTIKKVRHHLRDVEGVTLAIDEFQDALAGLLLAEAEFETDEALHTWPTPDFAEREVTDDPRYTGGWLASNGKP